MKDVQEAKKNPRKNRKKMLTQKLGVYAHYYWKVQDYLVMK